MDTVLFDLDGTLAGFSQKPFIDKYFGELAKVFVKMGMDAGQSIKAVWAGTKAMLHNDGSMLNKERFWITFADSLGLDREQTETIEAACDSFYTNEFNAVKSILSHSEIPARLVRHLVEWGYDLVLATNPLFPECAVETRLGWIGLSLGDFKHITHYANSSFCKPSLKYYEEIFSKIRREPHHCIMVGNNPSEDMVVHKLGARVHLVTDFLENEEGADITEFRHGTLEEVAKELMSMPGIMRGFLF